MPVNSCASVVRKWKVHHTMHVLLKQDSQKQGGGW